MMEMAQTFWKEAKENALDFLEFCRKEKGLRWFTAILLVTFWGIKLVYNDVFIDSEVMSLEPWALLQSWYGHKRYGLILMKRLFSMIRLVPYLSNLLFLAVFWGMILLVCYSLRQWFGGNYLWANRRSFWMFSAFWVTAPSLAEQYAFTLQAFEITLAMVFCVLAAYFADLAIVKSRSKLWYLAALGFLVWGLASYQGLCSFYIALVLISFLGNYERNEQKGRLKMGVLHLAFFVIAFGVYTLLGELLCQLKGGSSVYVDSMFLWGKVPAAECLETIKTEFRALFCGAAASLYHGLAGAVFLLGGLGLAASCLKKRKKEWGFYLIALILLAVSPLYVSILTGMRTPVRSQLVFPPVFAFFDVILWNMFCSFVKRISSVGARGILCAAVTAFFFFQSWLQGMNLVQLNQTLHDTLTHDMLTAQRIYMDVCRVADRSDMQSCPVVFVGTRDAKMPQAAVRGETIGHSFFDFAVSNIGVTNRVIGLFNYYGMNVGGVSAEQYEAARKAAAERDSWPANEGVFLMDDCVVVKLSD